MRQATQPTAFEPAGRPKSQSLHPVGYVVVTVRHDFVDAQTNVCIHTRALVGVHRAPRAM